MAKTELQKAAEIQLAKEKKEVEEAEAVLAKEKADVKKAEAKLAKETKAAEAKLIKDAKEAETKLAKANAKAKNKPKTDRQKFHAFFRDDYLKGSAELVESGEPHHADKHGMLGYEDNLVEYELQSDKTGKLEKIKVSGLCINCSKAEMSAKEAYAKK